MYTIYLKTFNKQLPVREDFTAVIKRCSSAGLTTEGEKVSIVLEGAVSIYLDFPSCPGIFIELRDTRVHNHESPEENANLSP